jgi:hypothetical protein
MEDSKIKNLYNILMIELGTAKGNTKLLHLLCKHLKESKGIITLVTNYGMIHLRIFSNNLDFSNIDGCFYLHKKKSITSLISCTISTSNEGLTFKKNDRYLISIEEEYNILEPFEGLLKKLTGKKDIVILSYKEIQNSFVN